MGFGSVFLRASPAGFCEPVDSRFMLRVGASELRRPAPTLNYPTLADAFSGASKIIFFHEKSKLAFARTIDFP